MAPWYVLAVISFSAGMVLAWFFIGHRVTALQAEILLLRGSLEYCERNHWNEAAIAWSVLDAAGGSNVYREGGDWHADPYRKGFRRGASSVSPLLAVMAMKIPGECSPE